MISRLAVLLIIFQIIVNYPATAQEVRTIKFPELKHIIDTPSEKVKVFNFWATWCKPCIVELPFFEALGRNNKEATVYLVSLDFPTQLESRLIPFIRKKDIQSQVLLLDETDFNAFIDKIDPSWSGAIPATLMIGPGGEKYFHEGELKEDELNDAFQKISGLKVQP